MAFPAPPDAGTDVDVDVDSAGSVILDGTVEGAIDAALDPTPPAGPGGVAGTRGRVRGDVDDDGDVLDDAAIKTQLQLASLGVLLDLVGLPERIRKRRLTDRQTSISTGT